MNVIVAGWMTPMLAASETAATNSGLEPGESCRFIIEKEDLGAGFRGTAIKCLKSDGSWRGSLSPG